MPVTKAQRRAQEKYLKTEKGQIAKKAGHAAYRSKLLRISVEFSHNDDTTDIFQQAIADSNLSKSAYAKQAIMEKLVRDGYIKTE